MFGTFQNLGAGPSGSSEHRRGHASAARSPGSGPIGPAQLRIVNGDAGFFRGFGRPVACRGGADASGRATRS